MNKELFGAIFPVTPGEVFTEVFTRRRTSLKTSFLSHFLSRGEGSNPVTPMQEKFENDVKRRFRIFFVHLGMQREVTSGYLPESSWKVTGSVNIWILIYVEYNQQVIRRIGLQK